MRLALSSAAAPDLELTELLATCARRGMEGLELVSGDGHGVAPGLGSRDVARLRRELASSPVRLTGLHVRENAMDDAPELARLSISFGIPLVVPVGSGDRAILGRIAVIVAAERGRILIRHGTNDEEAEAAEEIVASLGCIAAGTAWEVRPGLDDPAAAARLLDRRAAHLRYVRLHGGGPEAAEQGGHGVGSLMSRLALQRFVGPLVLAPSTPRYHYAWSAWLGRAGGWGCGSKVGSQSIHMLQPA